MPCSIIHREHAGKWSKQPQVGEWKKTQIAHVGNNHALRTHWQYSKKKKKNFISIYGITLGWLFKKRFRYLSFLFIALSSEKYNTNNVTCHGSTWHPWVLLQINDLTLGEKRGETIDKQKPNLSVLHCLWFLNAKDMNLTFYKVLAFVFFCSKWLPKWHRANFMHLL